MRRNGAVTTGCRHRVPVANIAPPRRCLARCKLLLGILLISGAPQAWPAQCNLSAQGVSFGVYDTFSNQSVDSTGNIAVSCDVSAPYSISLSAGSGSFESRWMANGSHKLVYNLYLDAARTAIWGDGAGGSSIASGNGTAANHAVYGRIPARQNAYVGSYADNITVTISF